MKSQSINVSETLESEVKTPQVHEVNHTIVGVDLPVNGDRNNFTVYPLTMLCSDFEHNQKTASIWIDCRMVCGGTLNLPKIPKKYKNYCRYCVDLCPDSRNGRWVNVVFDDVLVRVFCSSFKELYDYVHCFG